MEKQERDYTKTNRVMAEFIGYIEKNHELFVEDRDDINPILKHKFFLRDAKFHLDWSWLMPVVNERYITDATKYTYHPISI